MLTAKSEEPKHEGPPRCPWCGKPAVGELGAVVGNTPTRYFRCNACGRTFKIALELIDEPGQNE